MRPSQTADTRDNCFGSAGFVEAPVPDNAVVSNDFLNVEGNFRTDLIMDAFCLGSMSGVWRWSFILS